MSQRQWSPPRQPVTSPTVLITERLADALDGLCLGLTNGALSRRLGVTEAAVRRRVERLCDVLGAQSRAHVVSLACSGQVTVVVQEGRS